METERRSIAKTVSSLRSSIGRLRELGINVDQQGELKEFLFEYVNDQVVDQVDIKNQILPIL